MLPSVLTRRDDLELPQHEAAAVGGNGSGPHDVGNPSPPPVVVSIDGSKEAVQLAIWASIEALKRGTFLRLVHVITGHPRSRDRGYAYAGQILHKACKAVHSANSSVMVDSDVLEGDLATQLAEMSRGAEMICIGSAHADSTVTVLRRRAHAPIVIMRPGPPRPFGHRRGLSFETLLPRSW